MYFSFSGDLLTEEMIVYDKWLFSQAGAERQSSYNSKELRLFFYGYHSAIVKCRDFFRYVLELPERDSFIPHGRRYGRYRDMDPVAYADQLMREECDLSEKDIERFVNRWNATACKKTFSVSFGDDNESLMMPATVYLSASPFKIKFAHLYFKKKANIAKRLPTLRGIPTIDLSQTNLPNTAFPSSLDNIVVHKVGQGLCVEINENDGGDTGGILYDVGLTLSEEQSDAKFKEVKARLNQVSPRVIIVSHLHLDHFVGVKLLSDSAFNNAVWVVSWRQNGRISESAKRLVAYLYLKNWRVYFVNSPNVTKTIQCGAVTYELGQGAGRKVGGTSACNNSSLLLKIAQNGKDVLLTGDCIYSAIPFQNSSFDFLQVPHHGCDLKGKTDVRKFKAKPGGVAVISFGYNTYNHPNFMHSKELIDNGFSVKHTLSDKVEFHF